jgi:uncharacterized DUF497 family protein
MINLDRISGFAWGDGNNRKSADKHDVSQAEADNFFFNDPLIVVENVKHSEREQRLMHWERHLKIAYCTSLSPLDRMEQRSG